MKRNVLLIIAVICVSLLGISKLTYADSGWDSGYSSSDSGSSSSSSSDFSGGGGSGGSGGRLINTGNILVDFLCYIFIAAIICCAILVEIYYHEKAQKIVEFFTNLFYLVCFIALSICLFVFLRSDDFKFGDSLWNTYLLLIIFGYIIIAYVIYKKKHKKLIKKERIKHSNLVKIKKDIINISEFNDKNYKNMVFDIYKRIQIAWMNNNLEEIRQDISNAMYNTYQSELDLMDQKNEKNMMEKIKYKKCYLYNVLECKDKIYLEYILKVSCRDYIINKLTNIVVRGKKHEYRVYTYNLKFEYNLKENITNCPNCRMKLENASNAKCSHCGSIIKKDSTRFTLVNKELIEEFRISLG